MASNKYQGFETNRFYGVFCSEGEAAPIAIGRSKGEALDALIRKVAEDDGIETAEAQEVVDSKLDHGDYFVAPIALRGAFQNDGDHKGSMPASDWIDEALGGEDPEETRSPADVHKEAQGHFAETIAMLFVHFGCENYIAFDVQIPTLGLTTVTVQRASGLTPVQKLQKAQDELAEVRTAAKERASDAEREMRKWAAIALAVERVMDGEGDAEAKLAKIKQALVLR